MEKGGIFASPRNIVKAGKEQRENAFNDDNDDYGGPTIFFFSLSGSVGDGG